MDYGPQERQARDHTPKGASASKAATGTTAPVRSDNDRQEEEVEARDDLGNMSAAMGPGQLQSFARTARLSVVSGDLGNSVRMREDLGLSRRNMGGGGKGFQGGADPVELAEALRRSQGKADAVVVAGMTMSKRTAVVLRANSERSKHARAGWPAGRSGSQGMIPSFFGLVGSSTPRGSTGVDEQLHIEEFGSPRRMTSDATSAPSISREATPTKGPRLRHRRESGKLAGVSLASSATTSPRVAGSSLREEQEAAEAAAMGGASPSPSRLAGTHSQSPAVLRDGRGHRLSRVTVMSRSSPGTSPAAQIDDNEFSSLPAPMKSADGTAGAPTDPCEQTGDPRKITSDGAELFAGKPSRRRSNPAPRVVHQPIRAPAIQELDSSSSDDDDSDAGSGPGQRKRKTPAQLASLQLQLSSTLDSLHHLGEQESAHGAAQAAADAVAAAGGSRRGSSGPPRVKEGKDTSSDAQGKLREGAISPDENDAVAQTRGQKRAMMQQLLLI